MTRTLIAISDFLRAYGLYLLVLILAVLVVRQQILSRSRGGHGWPMTAGY